MTNYYITSRCNSKCIICDIWNKKKYKQCPESSFNEIKSILQQLKKVGVIGIDFTGGEPLLAKNIIDVLSEAKKLGFIISLTTNGLLYKKYAKELKGKINSLSFSLDSAYPNEHNKIRGIKCFHLTIESMKLAKSLGEAVMIKHTVTNNNYKDLPALIKVAEKMKVLLELNPEFAYFGNFGLDKEKVKQLFKYFFLKNVILSLAHLQFILDGGNKITNPRCLVGQANLVVSPDGCLVFPCFHKQLKKVKIKGNLKKLLQTDKVKAEIKKVGKYDFCEGCTIPCFMEPSYTHYKKIDKYTFLNIIAKGDYLRKRFSLFN